MLAPPQSLQTFLRRLCSHFLRPDCGALTLCLCRSRSSPPASCSTASSCCCSCAGLLSAIALRHSRHLPRCFPCPHRPLPSPPPPPSPPAVPPPVRSSRRRVLSSGPALLVRPTIALGARRWACVLIASCALGLTGTLARCRALVEKEVDRAQQTRGAELGLAGGAVTVARPGSARLGAGGDSGEEGAVGWRRGTGGSEAVAVLSPKRLKRPCHERLAASAGGRRGRAHSGACPRCAKRRADGGGAAHVS